MKRYLRKLITLSTCIILLSGCAYAPVNLEPYAGEQLVKPPDIPRLKERVSAVYKAWLNRDYQSVYQIESPRLIMSYDQWLKDSRLPDPESEWINNIKGGRLVDVCDCTPYSRPDYPSVIRCRLITEVTSTLKGQGKTARLLEMWEYAEGDWYHGFSAGDELNTCSQIK